MPDAPGTPAPLLPDAGRPLTYDRTVARSLVHRACVAEVFLTDAVRDGADDFRLAAQWPRTHGFYRLDAAGRQDPLLVIETVRQAALLLAHLFYGVPQGHQFIFTDLAYELVDEAGLHDDPAHPSQVAMDARLAVLQHRKGLPVSLRLEVAVVVDGVLTARVRGGLRCIPPSTYALLRARTRAQSDPAVTGTGRGPVPVAASVDLLVPRQRVAGRPAAPSLPPHEYEVVVDQTHPLLFDHPLDHVPGMLLVTAVLQAALAAVGPDRLCVELEVQFVAFAELDTPTLVRVDGAGDGQLRVCTTQGGTPVAEGRARLRQS